MKRFIAGISILISIGFVLSARAEVYRWVDEKGQTHFAQDLQSVPREYRSQVEARFEDENQGASPVQVYEAPAVKRQPWKPIETPTYRKNETEVKLRRASRRSGFLVDVRLNGQVTAPFLLDTGATHVVITREVADQLGIDIGPNTPFELFGTANGVVKQPIVLLDMVEVEGAYVTDVKGSVSPSMEIGLLGTAFLNYFEYSIDPINSVLKLRARNQD